MPKLKIYQIIYLLIIGFVFADPPSWDIDGDGVLDNYNDYENNGSITALVTTDGINSYAESGDMIACFVGDEQRGVGLTNLVPFGPYAGTYQFQMMIYSNVADGETLIFQYYDISSDIVYNLNETLGFLINMTEGNVTAPIIFTFEEVDDGGGDESGDSDFVSNGLPDWDLDNDGVLDNYNDYENNGSVTAMVSTDGLNSFSGPGDMIACFVNGEQRGVGLTNLVPFGPYVGTYQFQMMMYSNIAEGETLNFQYYNQVYDAVYNLNETLGFVINMTEGNVVSPYIFTFNPGDVEDIIYGCTDVDACNYDASTTADDGSCEYAEDFYDCDGVCLLDTDGDEVCDELEILGCTDLSALNYSPDATEDDGSCLTLGCTDESACNYDPNATVSNDSCEYSEENFDCDGNCLVDLDCYGLCGGNAVFDCTGECGGFAIIDECGICEGNGIPDGECDCDGNVLDCAGDCGGLAELDECDECGGSDLNGNGFCDPTCPDNYVLNPQFPNVNENNVCVPELFIYNISTVSAGYLFYEVTINGIPVNNNDWVGAFNGDICVGSQIWNTGDCSNGICSISVMGSDNDGFTSGYMLSGDIPQFKIYDASENIYYDAFPTENVEWQNFGFSDIALLSTQNQGCTDQLACNFDEFAIEDNGTCEYDSCYGCTDLEALNFDSNATIDDGSCIFDFDLPPVLFEFNQSTQQAFYFFEFVSIDNIELDENDWVAAFNGDTCVGSRKWDTSLCGEGICDLPVMGDDNEEYSFGYMSEGQIPTFKIYDYSEQSFYNAIASNDIAWENNGTFVVDFLNVFPDCAEVLGGESFIDNCGNCVPFDSNPDAFIDDCGICYGENLDQDCLGVCFGDALIDDCGNCSLPDDFNSAQDDCGVCNGDNLDQDCLGECFGDAVIDDCGVCDGNNLDQDCLGECFGDAVIDDCGICDGNNLDQDCAGECFGDALIDDCGDCSSPDDFNEAQDECGVCNGDNSSCSGCTDPNALNYDDSVIIDDGSCYYTIPLSIDLDGGANLVSFYALPENLEFQNFISPLSNSVTGIITEGSSSILYENQWLGSILSIDPANGYWFIMNQEDVLELDGYPLGDEFEYSLHEGANLISFPSSGSYLLDDVLPDFLDGIIYGIIAEGQSAYYLDGNWVGLDYLEGGKGYWFKSYEDALFTFNIENSESLAARSINYNDNVLQGFEYVQSSEQAFYYFDNIPDASIGDWIIAFNNGAVVGSKEWNGQITDIAVMGYMSDEYYFSNRYCKHGDIPDFILYKTQTGEEIPLFGNINPWVSNDISYIGTLSSGNPGIPNNFGLNSIYPNPFNPITTIDFYVPNNIQFSLSVFDIQGRLVDNIISNEFSLGNYSVKYKAENLSSGVYFIQLKTPEFIDHSKIVLLK